jgi:hypothetical protein
LAGPLAPVLEYGLINSLFKKEITYQDIERKTLSNVGQTVHKAVQKFVDEGVEWNEAAILTLATEGFGADHGRMQEYLANVARHTIPAASSIYQVLKDRNALINIINEINKQLTTGDLDLSRLQQYTTSRGPQLDLTTASDDLENGEPVPPEGPKIVSLPRLSQATNGAYGIYLIAGMPNVGKSTVGAQVTTDIAAKGKLPCLVYDYENGRNAYLYRLVRNFGMEQARRIGKRIFIRESLKTLNRDLNTIKPPAVLVIDSIQKIATKSDDRREGLDGWVHRFEEIKKEGYHVVLISEINRASYSGDPKLDCFKETGALEYAADSAVVLQEASEGLLKLWLVKNRHYPLKGQIGMIERSKQREFWFQEVEMGLGY